MIRDTCRMCQGDIHSALTLQPTPIANLFPREPNTGDFHPLELMECDDCGHVQLKHVLSGLFDDYKYRTPDAYKVHLDALLDVLKEEYHQKTRILEIGANNGLFIYAAEKRGYSVIAVDPCLDITLVRGFRRYFDEGLADLILPVDMVVALNTFAHIDNLDSVFRGVQKVLKPDGVLVFEVQDFESLAEHGLYDMVYHEHVDYHTTHEWDYFLHKHGFRAVRVDKLDTHGGSFRIIAEKAEIKDPQVTKHSIDWADFNHKVEKSKNWVYYKARECANKKGKLAIFGAPAKITTIIHNTGIKDLVSYVVDSTPEKQNRYIAGTDIQIQPEHKLHSDPPDIVMLGAWNYENVFKAEYPDLDYFSPHSWT